MAKNTKPPPSGQTIEVSLEDAAALMMAALNMSEIYRQRAGEWLSFGATKQWYSDQDAELTSIAERTKQALVRKRMGE